MSTTFRVALFNHLFDLFDAGDCAAAELDLPGVAGGDGEVGVDVGCEGWGVPEAAEGVESYRDAVVGKHGD